MSRIEQPRFTHGPGSEFARLAHELGVQGCQACTELAKRMDHWGVDGCRQQFDKIVDEILPRMQEWYEKRDRHELKKGLVRWWQWDQPATVKLSVAASISTGNLQQLAETLVRLAIDTAAVLPAAPLVTKQSLRDRLKGKSIRIVTNQAGHGRGRLQTTAQMRKMDNSQNLEACGCCCCPDRRLPTVLSATLSPGTAGEGAPADGSCTGINGQVISISFDNDPLGGINGWLGSGFPYPGCPAKELWLLMRCSQNPDGSPHLQMLADHTRAGVLGAAESSVIASSASCTPSFNAFFDELGLVHTEPLEPGSIAPCCQAEDLGTGVMRFDVTVTE